MRKSGLVFWLPFLLIAMAVGSGGAVSKQTGPASVLGGLLPSEVLGWTAESKDAVYDAETIFDYIDGAGEVYRAYNMKALVSRRFHKTGGPDIIADLFDMGSAADAFGVFSHDLDGDDWHLGQDSLYKGGLLTIWKGRYYAALYAEDETAESKAALREMGRRLAEAIRETGIKPDLLGALPPGYDNPGRVRFLHSPVILNYHYSLARENILGLDERTDAVLSRADDKSVLIVVRYPDEARAGSALRTFRAALMPGTEAGRAFRAADGTWTMAAARAAVVAFVLRAVSAEAAVDIAAAAIERVK
ncbi:MAG: hypothetical protein PHI34_12615 [Acidobacteriota bacterium]|nr:hypothetical protein [Acidobacteriota bacterium]